MVAHLCIEGSEIVNGYGIGFIVPNLTVPFLHGSILLEEGEDTTVICHCDCQDSKQLDISDAKYPFAPFRQIPATVFLALPDPDTADDERDEE